MELVESELASEKNQFTLNGKEGIKIAWNDNDLLISSPPNGMILYFNIIFVHPVKVKLCYTPTSPWLFTQFVITVTRPGESGEYFGSIHPLMVTIFNDTGEDFTLTKGCELVWITIYEIDDFQNLGQFRQKEEPVVMFSPKN